MQQDSVHCPSLGHIEDPHITSLQCSHCSLICKSKVSLFEHLSNQHGFDIDTSLANGGLKPHGTYEIKTDDNSNNSGDHLACQRCDFKAFSQDLLNEHKKQCQRKSENQNGIGNVIISENPKTTKIFVVLKSHNEPEGAKEISPLTPVKSTSTTKCTLESSKDLKTYKRPLQTITKYLVPSSGFKRHSMDGTKETLLLQESPSNSSRNSNGVFKVTAKPTIDIKRSKGSTHFLLSDHLPAYLNSPNPKEQFNETVPDNFDERPNNESSEGPPAKKAKTDKDETQLLEKANASKQQSSSNMELSFEFSEGEEENNLKGIDVETSKSYVCKLCDFSVVGIRTLSTHYQNNHPHIRYNTVYLQDPIDQSATFRCLKCPTEFSNLAELERHYKENHPEASHVFAMQSHDLSLAFKCFVCPFETGSLKSLKNHYKEKHPTHEVDNSLMYCRYAVTKCQEGSPQLNECEEVPSPDKTGAISPESTRTLCKEVKKKPVPLHPSSMEADMALYHCNNCQFSHKSVVVMHVHYQKNHPTEAVTIDKIKQIARDTSHPKSMMPDMSPNSKAKTEKPTATNNHSDSQKPRNKEKLTKKRIKLFLRKPLHIPEAPKTHSETPGPKKLESAEDRSKEKKLATKCSREVSPDMDSLSSSSPNQMFYCQHCTYSSTNIKSVVGHHNAKHSAHEATDIDEIALYSAEVQKKKPQNQVTPSTQPSVSKTCNQVEACSGKQLQNEENEATGASVMESNAFAFPENLYYCQKCNFGTLTLKGVVNHQNRIHKNIITNKERVIKHTALIRNEIKKAKNQEKDFVSRLPLPFINEGETDALFCHFCNYRHSALSEVLKHYISRHPGFVVQSEQIHLYSSIILEKIKKSHPKTTPNKQFKHSSLGEKEEKNKETKKFGKVLESSSTGVLLRQRTLKCHKCPYKTQHVYLLRRHMWQIHKAQRTVTEVLRMCYKQGIIQTGYHCDMCVFSDQTAQVLYDHYKEKHLKRSLSLEHITTRLHAGPKATTSKSKNPQTEQTESLSDGDVSNDSLPSQRSESETKMYSCKACSFKSDSMSNITQHYRAVHPWSVKEDGSVLDVINSRKPCANRQLEDHLPVSFETYQVPLEIENSHGSSKKTAKKGYAAVKCPHCAYRCTTNIGLGRHLLIRHSNSSVVKAGYALYKCALCSSSYLSKKRLGSHYAKKHGNESFQKYFLPLRKKPLPTSRACFLAQQQKNNWEASESSTMTEGHKILVFKCPTCPYVNGIHHGTLTHCQMMHPDIIGRADALQTEEILVTNIIGCEKGGNSTPRGFMCKKCPQIHASLKKLRAHCKRDHDQTEETTSEHSVKIQTERFKHETFSFQQPVLEAFSLKNQISAVSTTEIGLSQHLETIENQFNTSKEALFECTICPYTSIYRRYLQSHYRKYHKFDTLAVCKLLEKYNKGRHNVTSNPMEAQSEESATVKCKMCPNLMFESSEQLIGHFRTVHNSDRILDFIVLSRGSKYTTGLYKCAHCKKQLNGIRKMCYHLDKHRERENKKAKDAETLDVNVTTPEEKSVELFTQGELPILETVEELAKWNVTGVKTMTLPQSPLSSPSKSMDLEQPEEDSREDIPTCKNCGRTFMSLKGLRSHERSHAALAAIKKHNLPASVPKHKINKYIIYKSGTTKPFLCSFCSYRTNVMGLWRRHFMKNHQDVLTDPVETEDHDEESAQSDVESPQSEEWRNFPEADEKPEINKRSLYLEPHDVQRQLSLYNLMAQAGASSKGTVKENKSPENSLFHCEMCNFNTSHLSSMRRHYLHRHGKKILRCKDCNFFTCSRKTLKMHIEMVHSTSQSELTHQKDFQCPFCLYQTKNKNNMIDHILLHRDKRLVPIEVRRSKLSRCLQGIVFRCHNCTFTSGNAENLHMHMMKHDEIKPYKCRLCYFDCTRLSDLEAHLSDKHQVMRNHELVGEVSLNQLEARVVSMPEDEEEPLSDRHNSDRMVALQIEEAYQKQRNDGKNTDEERAESDLRDHDENTQPNPAVQERYKQDTQEQERIVFLQETAREQGVENTVGQNVSVGNKVDTVIEDCNVPKKENQDQTKLQDEKESSITFIKEKEEAEDGSLSCKIAKNAQSPLLYIDAPEDKTLNIEARVEKDVLDNMMLLDDKCTIPKMHKKANLDRDIKVAQNIKNLEEEGSISLAPNQINIVSIEAKVTHIEEHDIGAKESLTVKRNLQTLPNCAQLKKNHEEHLDCALTNCKEEQIHKQKNSDEGREPYGEMPVLENEYLKEEMNPLEFCQEQDQNNHFEEKQNKEDKMTSDGDKDEEGFTDKEREESDGIKDVDEPQVPKGSLTVMDEAAKDLCSASSKEKPFTCELCGRNLLSSFELERHIMRHGI